MLTVSACFQNKDLQDVKLKDGSILTSNLEPVSFTIFYVDLLFIFLVSKCT